MRSGTALVAAILTGASFVGCQRAHSHDASAPSLLFVQVAETGALVPADGGTYLLRLDDPGSRVVYFTDRPYRMTGSISMDEFLDAWSEGADDFADDPPNAALSVAGTEQILVLELADPVRNEASLQYTARALTGSDHYGSPHRVGAADDARELAGITLFIDNLRGMQDPLNQPAFSGTNHHWEVRPLWRNP